MQSQKERSSLSTSLGANAYSFFSFKDNQQVSSTTNTAEQLMKDIELAIDHFYPETAIAIANQLKQAHPDNFNSHALWLIVIRHKKGLPPSVAVPVTWESLKEWFNINARHKHIYESLFGSGAWKIDSVRARIVREDDKSRDLIGWSINYMVHHMHQAIAKLDRAWLGQYESQSRVYPGSS